MKFIDKYQIPIFITMAIAGMLIIISAFMWAGRLIVMFADFISSLIK